MATINWGLLSKSQVDPEKIEEAIARLIVEHNENEEAHLGVGQSLQSHKAAEIIDHLVDSIVADKIRKGEVTPEKIGMTIFQTFFESTDGYLKTAGAGFEDDTFKLLTTNVLYDFQSLFKRLFINIYGLTFSKKRILEVGFYVSSIVSQEIWISVGSIPHLNHIGFHIHDNVLYGSVGNDTVETTVELSGVNLAIVHLGRVEFFPGDRCDFFIDGVLKGTISTNLPTGISYANSIVNAFIRTNSTEAKALYLSYWDFRQEP